MIKKYAMLDGDLVINLILSDEDIEFFDGKECIEYSEDGSFRINPATIGGRYIKDEDVFISKQPYLSWTLNTSSYKWEPPIAKPEGPAAWDELNQRWNTPE